MIDRNTRVFAELSNFGRRVDLHLMAELPDGRRAIVRPVIVEVLTDLQLANELQDPALSMHNGTAQVLMDELWRIGFRPAEGTGSASALAATERHLKDMLRLTFTLLDGDTQLGHIARGQVNSATLPDRPPPF